MQSMQQRLAVASILVLVLMAGASAVLIVHNAYGQNPPNASSQSQNSHDQSTNSGSTTTSSGGSLLTNASHNNSYSDDGNETEHEIENETGINSTLDD